MKHTRMVWIGLLIALVGLGCNLSASPSARTPTATPTHTPATAAPTIDEAASSTPSSAQPTVDAAEGQAQADPPEQSAGQEGGEPPQDSPPQPGATDQPASTPTPTPDLDAGAAQGQVSSIDVIPAALADPAWRQLGPGDSYTITWRVEQANQVRLCTNDAGGGACYEDLPLEGSLDLALRAADPVADHWVDVVVEARGTIQSDQETLRLYPRCHYQWFQAGLSTWCPDAAAQESEALAQPFERGWMTSLREGQVDLLIAPTASGRSYNFLPPRDLSGVDLTPPAGFSRPEDRFAAVWAGLYGGTEDVQDALGRAVGEARAYAYRFQCERRPGSEPYLCFERGPDGRVRAWTDFVGGSPDSANEGIAIGHGEYRLMEE